MFTETTGISGIIITAGCAVIALLWYRGVCVVAAR